MSGQRDRGHSWLGIRDILSQSLKQVEVDAKVSLDWAGLCWALVVGKEIAAVSHVSKVAPKTLYIEVAEKEWVSSLEALRKKIIPEMKQQAGFEGLTQILFKEAQASDSAENGPRAFAKNHMRLNANPDVGQGTPRRSKRRTRIKKT